MNNKKEIIEESICKVDQYGNKFWYNSKGELHRENDLPAIEYASGGKSWYLNGKYNRENDKPAIECAIGDKEWRLNGNRHRDNDKPAIEYASGSKQWYINGKLHRENGPAIEYCDGKKCWFWHDKHIEVNSQEEFEEKLPYLIMKDINEQ